MEKYLATYGKPRFLGIVEVSSDELESINKDRLIVVLSHRGEELAELVGLLNGEQENEYRNMRTISEHGEGPVRGGDPVVTDLSFIRVPSDEDISIHESHTDQEGENLRIAQELIEWHKLAIKLIDDEMLLDGKKLFFYFTSEQRVDFRTLVRDLARRFRTRIELRQMGVRDEARIIRGISSCGLPCCCSYWLNQFAPIGIKMVKEQNIALNPSKISGICGRLMCCMSFEHRVYREMWTGLPGPGSKIKTPNGNYIVQSLDIARNAVRCHKPSGGDIAVPKDLFTEFREAVINGGDWEVPEDAQAEMDSIRSCISCRAKPSASGMMGATQFQEPRVPEAADERGPDAEKEREAGEPLQKIAHRRAGRRRGRRGEKKPVPDGVEAQPSHTEHDGAHSQDRPHGREPLSGGLAEKAETTLGSAQADGDVVRRRRRRRRPKRSSAERGPE